MIFICHGYGFRFVGVSAWRCGGGGVLLRRFADFFFFSVHFTINSVALIYLVQRWFLMEDHLDSYNVCVRVFVYV